jgi:hypothetical protein
VVDAAQNMLDAEFDKTERGFPPRRIEINAARAAADHQNAARSVERHVANGQLDGVAQIGADAAVDRKYRFGRINRIDEVGVEITEFVAYPLVW